MMKRPSGAGRWQLQVCQELDACQLVMRQLGEFLWRAKKKQEAGESIKQEGDQIVQKATQLVGAFDRLADMMVVEGLYKELRGIEQGPDIPLYCCRIRIVKLKELMKCSGSVSDGKLQEGNPGQQQEPSRHARDRVAKNNFIVTPQVLGILIWRKKDVNYNKY